MTKRHPAAKTRRLKPLLHKARRHGTRSWTTWVPEIRISPLGAHPKVSSR